MVELDDTIHVSEPGPNELNDAPTIPVESTVPDGAGDFAELTAVSRDHYRIGDEIARGGMGRIVAARDLRAGRDIAIKEVRSDLLSMIGDRDREVLVRRFKREAMLTARLQHPAVVPVYEIGRFGHTPFIAMKRVDGVPLLQLFNKATDLDERLALLPQVIAVAEAIAYAHSEGVIHRDLKPANILVGSFGETVVIDWGLAKLTSEGDEAIGSVPPVPGDVETVAGAVFGTPSYMPPEQTKGVAVGPPADVYALGAILYQLLCGRAPYLDERSTTMAANLIDVVRERPPKPLVEMIDGAPADLISVVEKAMARDADERYSASQLVGELRKFQRGQQVSVHQYSTWELIQRWVNRHRALVVTAVLLTLAGAAATSWFVVQTIIARDQAQTEQSRAKDQLEQAMLVTYERGKRELAIGNRRQAIESLSIAYGHIDDPLLKLELGNAMLGLEGWRREIDIGAEIDGLVLAGDGTRLAVQVAEIVKLIDVTSGDVLLEVTGDLPLFIERGRYLVTRSKGQKLVVWNAADGSRVGELPIRVPRITSLAFGGDVLFINVLGKLTAISVRDTTVLFEIDARPHPVTDLSVSNDGQRLLASFAAPTIYRRDGSIVLSGNRKGMPRPARLSPDGSQFAMSVRGGVDIFSTVDGSRITGLESISPVQPIRFSADGTRLLVDSEDGDMCIWRISGPKRLGCRAGPDTTYTSYTPDLRLLANNLPDGSVELWDGMTGRRRTVLAAHEESTPHVEITADGKRVLTAGSDGAIRIWDGETDTLHGEIAYPRKSNVKLRNGTLAVAGDTLSIWNADKPETATQVFSSATRSTELALSGDGAVVAWAGQIWDIESGKSVATIPDWEAFSAVALDREGKQLIACARNGHAKAFDGRTGEPIWTLSLAPHLGYEEHSAIPLICIPALSDAGRLVMRSLGVDLVVNRFTGAVERVLERNGYAIGFGHAFYGDHHFASSDGQETYLFDLEGPAVERITSASRGLAAHPDGVRLLVPMKNRARIYNTRTRDSIGIRLSRAIYGGSRFSSDGRLVAVAQRAGPIEIFDAVGGRKITDRSPGESSNVVHFSPEGRLVAIGNTRTLIWTLPVENRSADEVKREVERVLGRRR